MWWSKCRDTPHLAAAPTVHFSPFGSSLLPFPAPPLFGEQADSLSQISGSCGKSQRCNLGWKVKPGAWGPLCYRALSSNILWMEQKPEEGFSQWPQGQESWNREKLENELEQIQVMDFLSPVLWLLTDYISGPSQTQVHTECIDSHTWGTGTLI